MKHKILFVCLGNICRSPSADGVMKAVVDKEGCAEDFFIDSAGTAAYHSGERADARMRKHALSRSYDLLSIARQVTVSDFYDFDYILAMDDSNYIDLERLAPTNEHKKKLYKMASFAINYQATQVPDPYYGGPDGFELVLDILEDAAEHLLKYIIKNQTA